MIKTNILEVLCLQFFLLALPGGTALAQEQPVKESPNTIPGDIYKIFSASCVPCHGESGGRLPKSKLNFSRWESYGAEKESEKANDICNEVTKGKMPPKSAREANPNIIPTREQVKLICNWAESLKSGKTKK